MFNVEAYINVYAVKMYARHTVSRSGRSDRRMANVKATCCFQCGSIWLCMVSVTDLFDIKLWMFIFSESQFLN